MAKMTLEELKKLRESKKRELEKREITGKDIEIIVGMATCGIAAGAKQTLSAFLNELEAQNLSNVLVRQTGCMGYCYAEPTVEIRMPGMPDIIYGKVDPETAVKIVRKHILGKVLINDHILDKPAADIMKK
ncbi:MAG: (2Fe-2S) ferredoxin domain-containing protein [Spirochaetes bacterium]|nr:(2Fe-2S) ferredoxin domain-containing protein [Spirochaetota bacterium]